VVLHTVLSFRAFRFEIPNGRRIFPEFRKSELRENFPERDGGGREMEGNVGFPGGS
jgi:hypothetical protein